MNERSNSDPTRLKTFNQFLAMYDSEEQQHPGDGLKEPPIKRRKVDIDTAYFVHRMNSVIEWGKQQLSGAERSMQEMQQELEAAYAQVESLKRQCREMQGESEKLLLKEHENKKLKEEHQRILEKMKLQHQQEMLELQQEHQKRMEEQQQIQDSQEVTIEELQRTIERLNKEKETTAAMVTQKIMEAAAVSAERTSERDRDRDRQYQQQYQQQTANYPLSYGPTPQPVMRPPSKSHSHKKPLQLVGNSSSKDDEVLALRLKLQQARDEIAALKQAQAQAQRKVGLETKADYEREINRLKTQLVFAEEEIRSLKDALAASQGESSIQKSRSRSSSQLLSQSYQLLQKTPSKRTNS